MGPGALRTVKNLFTQQIEINFPFKTIQVWNYLERDSGAIIQLGGYFVT